MDAIDGVDPAAITRAVQILLAGGLVAFPTETVYGLGADARNDAAVARIFSVKGRPTDHPLIVHLADAAALDGWAAHVPPSARLLADAFWPGPLTLLVPRALSVPDAVTGGRPTVGLRVPDHPVALALLAAFAAAAAAAADAGSPTSGGGGLPAGLAAPSANRYGRVSPTTAAHVRADLGDDVDLVLDGGPCSVGVESTIVDCTGVRPEILRVGGIGIERVAEVLGELPGVAAPTGAGEGPRAPGMVSAHYAPWARVEVVDLVDLAERAAAVADTTAGLVVVLAPTAIDGLPDTSLQLEPVGPADDYARLLYDRLRQADRLGAEVVLAVPPEGAGLAAAVRDRLQRAAAARTKPVH